MWRWARDSILNYWDDTPPDRKWREFSDDALEKREISPRPYKIRPKKENPGPAKAMDFVRTLHGVSTGNYPFQNTSDESAFELWYHHGDLDLVFIPGGQSSKDRFFDAIATLYPETQFRETKTDWPTPAFGHSVVVAEGALSDYCYLPMARIQDVVTDPLDSLSNAIAINHVEGEDDQVYPGSETRFVVQIMFKPATEVWCSSFPFGVDCESRADLFESGKYKGGILRRIGNQSNEIEPSEDDLETARALKRQYETPGYYGRIRLFAAAPDQQAALNHMNRVINAFSALTSPFSGQQVEFSTQVSEPDTFLSTMRDRDMDLSLKERLAEHKMMFSFEELASLLHLPTDNASEAIDFTMMDHGAGVPDEMPKFNDVVENTDFSEQDHKRLRQIAGAHD